MEIRKAQTIVIDVGSATHGGDQSIGHLISAYSPNIIFGFDPAGRDVAYVQGKTSVVERSAAAWIHDGEVGFIVAGLGGHVDMAGRKFPCVDLARYIKEVNVQKGDSLILKLDCEGAEYVLLPWLRENDADLALTLCVVEWHCEHCGIGGNGRHRENCTGDHAEWEARRARTESVMRCEMDEWGH